MALVRLAGDRIVTRLGPVLTVVWALAWRRGASCWPRGARSPLAALIGFALIGLGAANIVPVMFGAAGRLLGASPGISIATVTTLGYAGLLSGPALIGFLAQAGGLPVALAAVAGLLLLTAASARLVRPSREGLHKPSSQRSWDPAPRQLLEDTGFRLSLE
ncbi:hypothetical protein [Rhodanobacter lindaniclasticus]